MAPHASTCASSGVAVWNSFMAPVMKPTMASRPFIVSGAGPFHRIASAAGISNIGECQASGVLMC